MAKISKSLVEKALFYVINVLSVFFIVTTFGGSGSQGPAGSNGLPGSNGSNGLPGADGSNGLPGADGSNGLPGVPGADGGAVEYGSFDYEKFTLTGAAQQDYVEEKIEQGYVPLGSVADFSIFTYEDGDTMEDVIDAYANNYVLTNDIDFESDSSFKALQNFFSVNGNTWSGIGFSGIFDGAGFAILNFTQVIEENNDYFLGFFPKTDAAVIQNINFVNANIIGSLFYGYGAIISSESENTIFKNITISDSIIVTDGVAAGIVGFAIYYNYFLNVHVEGSFIHGGQVSGGFVGVNNPNYDANYLVIVDSSSSNSMIGEINKEGLSFIPNYLASSITGYAGGFVGRSEDITLLYIYNSFNASFVIASGEAGGFIGYTEYIDYAYIVNSYNSGTIVSTDAIVAGFIAYIYLNGVFTIQNSFNSGDIYGVANDIAGFIGYVGYDDDEDDAQLIVHNSYNSGDFSFFEDEDDFGGFFAQIDSHVFTSIHNSFTVGSVIEFVGEYNNQGYERSYGAFIGYTDSYTPVIYTNSYYYLDLDNLDSYITQATGNRYAVGVKALHDLSQFTYENFIFSNKWNFASIWEFTDASDYPTLQETPYFSANLDYNYSPFLSYWLAVSLSDNYDLSFTIISLHVYPYDFETALENLTIRLYISMTAYGSLEEVLEFANLAYTQQGDETINETFFTDESGLYHVYLVVTDEDGNSTYSYIGSVFTQLD